MAVIVSEGEKEDVTAALEGAGETSFEIGRIEEGRCGCTVKGSAGTWNSTGDWSATCNA
jgi:phosphoribosylformylglycinamidine cyclo-ligase